MNIIGSLNFKHSLSKFLPKFVSVLLDIILKRKYALLTQNLI